MKIILASLYILSAALFIYAATPFHNEIRSLYKKAAFEETSCQKLLKLLEPYNEHNNALMAGYKACATMMMAKHLLNPYRKLFNFMRGKELLEKSINTDRNNVELRFLRFTIQTNTPYFLDYNNNILQDKLFLINAISGISDPKLKQLMTDFLDQSLYLTSTEKKQLNL